MFDPVLYTWKQLSMSDLIVRSFETFCCSRQ